MKQKFAVYEITCIQSIEDARFDPRNYGLFRDQNFGMDEFVFVLIISTVSQVGDIIISYCLTHDVLEINQ